MLTNKIPSQHIVDKIARRNKDYDAEFINVDTNSDLYTLRVYLRRFDQDKNIFYRIRLQLICNTLSYPAFEMSWEFTEEEYELASRVFHRICDEVDDLKTEFDRSMAPASVIAPKIREAVKPISTSHQQRNNNLQLDESGTNSPMQEQMK